MTATLWDRLYLLYADSERLRLSSNRLYGEVPSPFLSPDKSSSRTLRFSTDDGLANDHMAQESTPRLLWSSKPQAIYIPYSDLGKKNH